MYGMIGYDGDPVFLMGYGDECEHIACGGAASRLFTRRWKTLRGRKRAAVK